AGKTRPVQAWWTPRQTGATQSGSQFRRIPLGHRTFSPRRRRGTGTIDPHRAARRFWPNAKK
ncbi:MAG: hypothetical protein K0U74_16120, partial [Alphaproteobacteria bacterium]|nr:hypothetical protein [Alphaproteobacteria bacterium]